MASAKGSLVLACLLLRCITGARVHSSDFDESAMGSGAGVQPSELAAFLAAETGLGMAKVLAEAQAKKEAAPLSRCGVTVPQLQALRDVLSSESKGLGLSAAHLRAKIWKIAYQHPDPADLRELFVVLSSGKLMGMESYEARFKAVELAKLHVAPARLEGLHNVMSKILDKPQEQTIDFAIAGADADTLKAQYEALTPRLSREEALSQAVKEAVKANLKGLEERYAQDAKPYSAKAFQDHYGSVWLKEWIASPQQKRTAMDGKDYTASEFKSYYGDSWDKKWSAGPEAALHRIADDGQEYSLQDFASFYKGSATSWQSKWQEAKEVLDLCAGLNKESCSSVGTCEWKWSGDWTTSCTPGPLPVKKACAGLNHESCDGDSACKWKWTGDWTTSCVPA